MVGLTTLATAKGFADQSSLASIEKICTGVLIAVNPQEQAVEVKSPWMERIRRFKLADDCIFVIAGKNTGSIYDLRVGEEAKIKYQNVHGMLTVSRIEQQPMRNEGRGGQMEENKFTLTPVHCLGADGGCSASNCANGTKFIPTSNEAFIQPNPSVAM